MWSNYGSLIQVLTSPSIACNILAVARLEGFEYKKGSMYSQMSKVTAVQVLFAEFLVTLFPPAFHKSCYLPPLPFQF